MTEEVKRYLEKSAQSIEVAEELLEGKYVEDACSKAYYAMFYAAKALLVEHEIDVHKHSAVVAKIGEAFVKPGSMDAQYHRQFIEAQRRRELADYEVLSSELNEDKANESIAWAKNFLGEVKTLLAGHTAK